MWRRSGCGEHSSSSWRRAPHFGPQTLHSTLPLSTPQASLHIPVYTSHSAPHTLHFTLHALHATFYTLPSTLYPSLSTLTAKHSAPHTSHCSLNIPPSALHTLHVRGGTRKVGDQKGEARSLCKRCKSLLCAPASVGM